MISRFTIRTLGTALTAFALGAPLNGHAQDTTTKGVRIGLRYDVGVKPGILVLPINGANGDSIRTMLMRDFDYGDRLTVITLDSANAAALVPASPGAYNYSVIAQMGAQVLVTGSVSGGELKVESFDVAKAGPYQRGAFALRGDALGPDWRMSVHVAADEVENWIFGSRGVAATRILFDRKGDGKIYIIDSDGANERAVTRAGTCMSAAWAPNAQSFAAACTGSGGAMRIHVQDFKSSTPRWVHSTGSLSAAPAFSPDGSTIIYASSDDDGVTDLVSIGVGSSGAAHSITAKRGGINTSPAFSPDGQRIVFTTDRLGTPQVYISNVDGTSPEVLSELITGTSQKTNPDWSPDSRSIAYQSTVGGEFQIFVTNVRDNSSKQLTSEGRNQEPSWAPDSRHLVIASSRSGPSQLWVLDTESGRVRQLTRRGANHRLPAWSPYLGSQK
jgi:TolB protein